MSNTDDETVGAVREHRSADEVREDIQRTREDMGDTVEALAAKTDVKGQAQQAVDDARSTAQQRINDAKEKVTGKAEEIRASAADMTPQSARHRGDQALAWLRDHPHAAALAGAAAAGFVIGRWSA